MDARVQRGDEKIQQRNERHEFFMQMTKFKHKKYQIEVTTKTKGS